MINKKRSLVWLYLLIRRYIRNPLYIFTILMIPIMVVALGKVSKDSGTVIKVALYCEDRGNNIIAREAMTALKEESNSIIEFLEVNDQEELYDMVASSKVVCGYIFPENFDEAVENYAYKRTAGYPYGDGIIKMVCSEESNYTMIANEMIITSFFDDFAHDVMVKYMEEYDEHQKLLENEGWDYIEECLGGYDINSNMFSFQYMDGTENEILNNADVSFLMLPLRGIMLVLILLASMTGAILLFRDKERGMFESITMSERGIINYIYILVPTVIAGIVGLISIFLSGMAEGVWIELICMTLYILFVTGIVNFVRRITGKLIWFVSIIPFFIIANLILCPVFIDLSSMIVSVDILQKVLPVYYGLGQLYNISLRYIMIVTTVVLGGVMVKDYK